MSDELRLSDDLTARAEREEQASLSVGNFWLWPILIALGLLVYELTAQPGLGAAVACVKFGWDEFLTAFWLRSRDPDRQRGWTCFWLYVAAGLCRVAASSVVVMFSVAILEAALRPGGLILLGPAKESYLIMILTAIVGFALSAVATIITYIMAARHRVKLWLDRQVHQDRRRDIWPPLTARRAPFNRVLFLVFSFLMCFITTVMFIAMIAVLGMVMRQFPPGPFATIFPIAAFIGIGGLELFFLMSLRGRMMAVVAASPAECWIEPRSRAV